MLVKEITYTDFDGRERTETYTFNLTRAEVLEMELSSKGGMTKVIENLIAVEDNAKLVAIYKDIILKSYGIKSIDGKRFEKSEALRDEFEQTGAYDVLFVELTTDKDAAAAFIRGIMPAEAVTNDHAKPELTLTQNAN